MPAVNLGSRDSVRRPAGRRRHQPLGRLGRDGYDNSLAETIIGLYKTEVIRRRGPWRTIDDVEFATLEWVHWFNTRRLFGPIGYVPPADHETNYYAALGQQVLPRLN